MKVVRDENVVSDDVSSESSVVAIGIFDGLHRGHHAILEQLTALAATYGARATVVTFDPAPAAVLAPAKAPRMLATLDQRLEGFATNGVELVRVLTFNEELSHESARDFIVRVLVGELKARCVIVGEDFHFGHHREGTIATLKELGVDYGYDVVSAPLYGEGERWSSTSVRRALDRGDLTSAEEVLGHHFVLRGDVVHGDARGDALGFPTANLSLAADQQLPREGVYVGATLLQGNWWPAAVSIGRRPQYYEHGELLVEVYVLDFAGDLYARVIDVAILARLRDQSTFADEQGLVEQIADDVAKTRQIFGEFPFQETKLLG